MRKLGVITGLCCMLSYAAAQSYEQVDTILTPEVYNHLYLRINNPNGELKVGSSELCGKSISQLSAKPQKVQPSIQTKTGPEGSLYRDVSISRVQPTTDSRLTARIALPVNRFNAQTEEGYSANYLSDPDIPTNLLVNLGSGSSHLDLSGMSINNLTVHSALSDVAIFYSAPNKSHMKLMQIHVASADISLENLELAKAEVINIRNDVGNTKVYLGARQLPGSHIRLMTGAGECIVRAHDKHPIKVILRNGIFSQVQIPESFEKVSNKVYVNDAYHKKTKKASTLICETDIGTITILEE